MIFRGKPYWRTTAWRWLKNALESLRSLGQVTSSRLVESVSSHARLPRAVESSRARIFIRPQGSAVLDQASQTGSSNFVPASNPKTGRPIRPRKCHHRKNNRLIRAVSAVRDRRDERNQNDKSGVS